MSQRPYDFNIRILIAASIKIEKEWWNEHKKADGFWRLYYNLDPGASIICNGVKMVLKPRKLYIIPAEIDLFLKCTKRVKHMYVHFDVTGISTRAMHQHFSRPMEVPNYLGMNELPRTPGSM
jgi:hypothetical protein